MQQQCSSAPHNCSTARSYSPSRVAPAVRVRSRWKFRISMAGYLVNNITPYEQLYGVFFNKKLKNVSCESTTDGWLKLNFASCVIRQTHCGFVGSKCHEDVATWPVSPCHLTQETRAHYKASHMRYILPIPRSPVTGYLSVRIPTTYVPVVKVKVFPSARLSEFLVCWRKGNAIF